MKSSMCIEVSFLGGTDLKDAVMEAQRKTYMFNVAYIVFSFNGIKFSISKYANVDDVLRKYIDLDKSKNDNLSIIE